MVDVNISPSRSFKSRMNNNHKFQTPRKTSMFTQGPSHIFSVPSMIYSRAFSGPLKDLQVCHMGKDLLQIFFEAGFRTHCLQARNVSAPRNAGCAVLQRQGGFRDGVRKCVLCRDTSFQGGLSPHELINCLCMISRR